MTSPAPTRAAIYARVSTFDQQPENQLAELRDYVQARGWSAHEYTDKGISGVKDNRPALDQLGRDAKRRKFGVLICWRLDRLDRSLKHLVTLLDELQVLGIAFVSLAEGIEPPRQRASCRCTSWLRSRNLNGLELPSELQPDWPEPATKAGKLGRPERIVPEAILGPVRGLPVREAARRLRVSPTTAYRWLFQKIPLTFA